MKRTLSIFLIFFISTVILAQNTGHVGKHLSIKTDLINGKRLGFTNADIEVPVSRNFSLSLSGRYFNYETADQNNVVIDKRGIPSSLLSGEVLVKKDVNPGKTEGIMGTIGAKYYFSKIMPAPVGFFVGLNLGGGYINSDYRLTTRNDYEIESSSIGPNPSFDDTTITSGSLSAPIIYGSPYVGYQTVFFKFLTFEAKIGLEGYYTLISSFRQKEVPYNYVEPNTVPIRAYPKKQSITGGPTKREYRLAVGPAVYVKVGFLLF